MQIRALTGSILCARRQVAPLKTFALKLIYVVFFIIRIISTDLAIMIYLVYLLLINQNIIRHQRTF